MTDAMMITLLFIPVVLPPLMHISIIWYFHSSVKIKFIPKHIVVKKIENGEGDSVYRISGKVWIVPVQIKCKMVSSRKWNENNTWIARLMDSYYYQMFFYNLKETYNGVNEIYSYINSSRYIKRHVSICIMEEGSTFAHVGNRRIAFYHNNRMRAFTSLSKAIEFAERERIRNQLHKSIIYKKKI